MSNIHVNVTKMRLCSLKLLRFNDVLIKLELLILYLLMICVFYNRLM